jgi:hypothetical protein
VRRHSESTRSAGALSSDSPPDLAYVRDGIVHVGQAQIAPGRDVSVSADGSWVAFVGVEDGNPELYVARPGRLPVRITFTPRAAEASPDWSPDGKRLVFERDGDLWITTVDRAQERVLARNARSPAWSPHGRIAYERGGWLWTVQTDGLRTKKLVRGTAAAWSWDNRLAYERDGAVFVGPRRLARNARAPAWSPDGRLAFERDGAVWAIGTRETWLRVATQPAWRARGRPAGRLPDLDQHAPSNLSIIESRGRFLVGFQSAVKNVGAGPLELVASRPSRATPVMTAAQRVERRLYPNVGLLRYKHADNHLHWHYLAFESYELRTLDGDAVVRDRKSGFCLLDRHPAPGRPPVFLDDCASRRTSALRVRQGSSSGNSDIYPAHFHGQNLNVTGVAAGLYVLAHRANPRLYLTESDYTNNAASVLIRLTWRAGRPSVRVLRRCEGSERCPAGAL